MALLPKKMGRKLLYDYGVRYRSVEIVNKAAQLTSVDVLTNVASKPRTLDDLPGPPHLPLFGATLPILLSSKTRKNMHIMQVDLVKKYGKVMRFDMGPTRAVAIACPRLMEEVYKHCDPIPLRGGPLPWTEYTDSQDLPRGLLTAQGDDWAEKRKSVRGLLLQTNSMETMVKPSLEVSKDLCAHLRNIRSSNGTIPELPNELYKWSFEAIVEVLFGSRAGCLGKPHKRGIAFINAVTEILGACYSRIFLTAKLERKLNTQMWRQHKQAWDTVFDSVRFYSEKTLADASNAPLDYVPLFVTLLQNARLSEQALEMVLADLFFAGVDTTSNTMGFALHSLASNPQAQLKLRQEIQQTIGSGEVTFSAIKRMSYLRNVIKETLRLYPILFLNGREMTRDFLSRSMNLELKKGDNVVFFHWAMSRDPELFDHADQFVPERFDRTNNKIGSEFSFVSIPFGFGTRGCIGKRVAEMELSVALIELVRAFDLGIDKSQDWCLESRTILIPGKDLPVTFQSRDVQ